MSTESKVVILLLLLLSTMIVIDEFTTSKLTPEELKEQQLSNQCRSRVRGSRPACWSNLDWESYCSRVQCKSK